jgi:hypothetical protein
MRTRLLLAIALSLASITLTFAQGGRGGGGQPAAPTQTIDARTTGFQKLDGYMPLYWDDKTGSLWMEINKFDTEMLYSTGLAAGLGSNDLGLDRGQSGQGRVVTLQRIGPRVIMVQPNYTFRANSANPDERRAVEDAFAKSILWASRSAPKPTVACSSTRQTFSSATRTTWFHACARGPSAWIGRGARSTCRGRRDFRRAPKSTRS